MNTSRLFSVIGAALPLVLIGCGGTADPSENLGVEQSALGEIGCATAGGIPYSGIVRNGRSATPTACGTTESFRASSASYDNGSTCSQQYIAEVRNIQGRKLSILPVWRYDAQPLSPGGCDGAKIEVAAYYRDAATQQWQVHTSKMRGIDFWGGCWVLPEVGEAMLPSVTGTEGYDMIRVAAYATYTTPPWSTAKITYKVPVGIDIVYPPSPC